MPVNMQETTGLNKAIKDSQTKSEGYGNLAEFGEKLLTTLSDIDSGIEDTLRDETIYSVSLNVVTMAEGAPQPTLCILSKSHSHEKLMELLSKKLSLEFEKIKGCIVFRNEDEADTVGRDDKREVWQADLCGKNILVIRVWRAH